MKIEIIHIDKLKPHAKNARKHPQRQIDMLARNIERFGFTTPVLIDEKNRVIAGHGRLLAMEKLERTEVPCVRIEGLTDEEIEALRLADNKIASMSEWDEELLAEALKELNDDQRKQAGFTDGELALLFQEQQNIPKLSDKFLIVPFSVLDARKAEWTRRKSQWKNIGIKSEEGREENLTFAKSSQSTEVYKLRNALREKNGKDPTWEEIHEEARKAGIQVLAGTSIFDPVLCELVYRWFSPVGGKVLDPFAGGSVRGITATILGRQYTGIDLSEKQNKANENNWNDLKKKTEAKHDPRWVTGDSRDIPALVKDEMFDLLFTCPPYADLEVYSDDPKDLSTMKYDEFLKIYGEIIKHGVDRLKENRFACIVVGNLRDKNGNSIDFVGDTIKAFLNVGAHFYNEAILVTALGSLPMRVGGAFANSRKMGRTHQNLLCFVKGDAKKAFEDAGEYCKMLVFVKGDGKEAATEIGEVDLDETVQILMGFGETLDG